MDDSRAARIEDHALIGDCHGAALVGRDGAIVWACLRRFDEAPVFARLLDPRAGAAAIHPIGHSSVRRRYLPDTNVLETEFTISTGRLRVLDAFAMRPQGHIDPYRQILRRIECVEGRVPVEIEITPRFDYRTRHPALRMHGDSSLFSAAGEDQTLSVWSETPLTIDRESMALRGQVELSAGESRRLALTSAQPEELRSIPLERGELDRRLEATIRWWRDWTNRGRYPDRHRDAVVRSALVLKLLTCAPTGAIIAAPTTSLPEIIGGARNWDYRFAWVRDASMSMAALRSVGHDGVARRLRHFLKQSCGSATELQIMYGCFGERRLDEVEVSGLTGFRGSRPVRVGNQAHRQLQLDMYGEIMTTAWLDPENMLDDDDWKFLRDVVEEAIRRWREPDRGIWESRGPPRHFVHSKAMCWLAVHRGLQLAARLGRNADTERWRSELAAIRASIDANGIDPQRGCFVRAYGSHAVDASLLRLALFGFVDAADRRFVATVAAIREDLGRNAGGGSLLRRYPSEEESAGMQDGAFLLCGFWLADVLAMQGKLSEAEMLFEDLVGRANDVGLLPEEVDPQSGTFLGNFPQAFSHMAIITTAWQLQGNRDPQVRRRPVAERT